MSEELSTTPVAETSSPAVADTPTSSTLVGDVSGEVTAEEVQSAAESSSQSDGTPATQTRSETKEEEPTNLNTPSFSLDSWDGVLESLPASIRELVSKKQKDLESGYTPKYQDLAEQRKTFESEAKKQRGTWEEKESQYALYKAMYEGREDPRVATMKSELEALTSKYDTESSGRHLCRRLQEAPCNYPYGRSPKGAVHGFCKERMGPGCGSIAYVEGT